MALEPLGATLPAHRLFEGLTALFRSVRPPVTALCVVQPLDQDDVALTHVDALGTSGHRVKSADVFEPFMRSLGVRPISEEELEAHADRALEARLLMIQMPEQLRETQRARHAVVVPLPHSGPRAALVVGLSDPNAPDPSRIAECERLGAAVWELLNKVETPEDELTRLRRLSALEPVLPALVDALDIRQIFERVSQLSKGALPHDFLSIGTFNDDRTRVQLYAQTSDWNFPESAPVQFAAVLVETFSYHIVHSLLDLPLDEAPSVTDFGARSSLRVSVRVSNRVVAALNFSSREPDTYGALDVEVAHRIADYVALALSHQRLAEESRRASALQEREANLEMLDGLLSTLAGSLDVRHVFERVSEIAKKVLPHDLLGLPLYSSDGEQLIVHAVVGVEPLTRPLPLSPMHRRLRNESWDHLIFDDILLDPDLGQSVLVPRGIRSLLRVAIRVEQRLVGFLDFGKFTVGFYGPAHVLVARRIADHVALALSHHRLSEEIHRATALAERTGNLQMLDELLNTISGVLDVREVFTRVSEIAKRVLPHDMMALPLASDDGKSVLVYAVAGAPVVASPQLIPFPEKHRRLFQGAWDHFIYDDIQKDPNEYDQPPAKAGYHSLLRIAIRLQGKLVGVLDFGSREIGFYKSADALIGRRIADHVSLVLSHQRLAEEMRRASALQERTRNLQLLDELLSALTGVLDIREAFARVSEIASKVLPHDAMGLPVVTDDREHIIPFATVGLPAESVPQIQPIHESVRPLLTEPWDVHVFEDIGGFQEGPVAAFAHAGYRSMMRACIRIDGRMVGALVFFSRTLGAFSHDDTLIARRIADHIAMVISHQKLADESRRAAALQERAANLEMLDGLLKTLTGVLDIREVFDRVSAISQKVLPHDAVAIGEVIEGGESIRMYASQGLGAGSIYDAPIVDRSLLTDPWDYRLFDDIAQRPEYGTSTAVVAGMHSVLFVPIRLEEGRLYGGLTFYSSTRGHFKRDDVLIAKRIADHIALALSHHRLADESRRAAALQERAASLDALDGLLNAVAGVLDVRSVFDRISEIGNTVMPHDAMTIGIRSGKPGIGRIYAATGALSHLAVPLEIPSPYAGLTDEPWDFRMIDDLNSVDHSDEMPGPKAGLRSILTMPIRFGGELVGSVNFLSRTPGRFTRDDIPMARRITDHIGLALSHEQLAQEMRKSEELRARDANIELLDALLASVASASNLQTVFERVTEIAAKVLRFDVMVVPVLIDGGARIRMHHLCVPGGMTFPEVLDVTAYLRGSDWEYDIVDDMPSDARQNPNLVKLGLRSAMRIAIRVEKQLTSGVAFYAFEPGVYKEADVAIGRRVAGRIAISLMREQGLQESKRADEASERASRLESRVQALTDELNARSGYHRVIGSSSTWRQALTQATQVASTETTVLLLGESGTGKEVVARFIHRASSRKNGPFVALNCAALPEQLLESELFGFERGAFTGAMNARAGKIEQAAGGVLFLDEVGEMSPTVQAKFLRVLQEREFQRLGGSKTLRADARVIAATNRDPKIAMEKGTFREDLYYRLSVFEISLPPLRERRDDILLLVENFLSDLARNIGRPAGGLSEDAKDRLLTYHWPGNVRELRNAIERAVILAEGGLITSDHLPIAVGQARPSPAAIPVIANDGEGDSSSVLPAGLKLETLERDLLNKAMAQAKNNKSQAAKLLGVPRGQFYSLLKRHGLTDAKR